MTPDQAKFLRDEVFLPGIMNEHKTTRKLIQALPADKGDYKPAEKNMTAWTLATHIVSSQLFFLNGILTGHFDPGGKIPDTVTTPEQLLEWDEENFHAAIDKVKAMPAEALAKEIDFFGVMSQAAVSYLAFMDNHTVHHRGQLSVYLRPMGAKVPAIYGGSADEPFTPAQSAAH